MTSPPPRRGVALRLAGAFVVGCLMVPLAALALVSLGFGGASGGLPYVAVLFGVGTLLFAVVHQVSGSDGRPAIGLSLVWGFGVLVLSLVLVGGFATVWQRSGSAFGRWPAVWWLLAGAGFALAAGLATRRTVLPAGAVLLLLGAGALAISWDSLRSPGQDYESTPAPSLVYVADIAGYGPGVQTSGSHEPALSFLPLDAEPPDGTGPDLSVLLTTQAPPPSATCGRTEPLPFDDSSVEATCKQLTPTLFLRVGKRYRELVRVERCAAVVAMAAKRVPVATLRDAVTSARLATATEVAALYRGWGAPAEPDCHSG